MLGKWPGRCTSGRDRYAVAKMDDSQDWRNAVKSEELYSRRENYSQDCFVSTKYFICHDSQTNGVFFFSIDVISAVLVHAEKLGVIVCLDRMVIHTSIHPSYIVSVISGLRECRTRLGREQQFTLLSSGICTVCCSRPINP